MTRPPERIIRLLNSGRIFGLGREVGRGGEGTVYEIIGDRSILGKIYSSHKPEKILKLRVMPSLETPQLINVAAWPKDLILNSQGQPIGFVMPRAGQRRDIHELYSPKSRAQAFTEADFRFLVRASLNMAKAFAVIHSHGYVIGDINHGNLLVGADATVVLIDCDSFQIKHGNQVHFCDVGSPLFTPPELQGINLNSIIREANHDCFGLAVLIFHLLFMGRHPFIGRYLGRGEMPPERAIGEYRFAYSPYQSQTQMQPPPGTLSLDAFGSEIASHFVKAFSPQGRGSRPTARDWISSLDLLEKSLKQCSKASWHHYFNNKSECPWCEIEKNGVRLFGQKISGFNQQYTDLEGIWRAITSIPDPENAPHWPPDGTWTPPPDIVRPSGFLSRLARKIGDISGSYKEQYRQEFKKLNFEYQTILQIWHKETDRSKFLNKLSELEAIKLAIENIEKDRIKKLKDLETKRYASQLEKYLDRFRLDRAKIAGIGESRTAILGSYGIETAADVYDRSIMSIPGFGRALTYELLKWRKSHENNFRFNPNEGIDSSEKLKVEQWASNERIKKIRTLQGGVSGLQNVRQEILAARTRLKLPLEIAWQAMKVAQYKLENWSGF